MLEDMLNRPLQPLLMNFYGLRAYIRARWTSYWTVSLAGFAVIVIGALCLGSSALIAATGSWWQGTLDAFGVGFVVGGVIDILAIFTLNQFVSRDTHRRASANQRARRILATKIEPHSSSWDLLQKQASEAHWLLKLNRGALDSALRDQLDMLIEKARGR